jgi:type VI secretion system protein ImpA
MPSPAVLDFDALLAPVAADRPSGEWLPDVHGAIEQARRADDDLPQGDWKRETKSADWNGVIKIATEALAVRTKDLKTAGFLVEALAKEHGLAGIRDGLRLLRELQERFWDSLHPQIEDGDLEGRIVPLEWLNGKLPGCVREIAVTRSRDGKTYSLVQWDESRGVERLDAEKRAQALAEGKLAAEQFDRAVAATPRAFYEALVNDLAAASDELQGLDRVLDEKFSREAPSLLGVRKALEQCADVLGPILRRKRELEPDAAPAASAAAPITTAAEQTSLSASGDPLAPIDPVDRADALRRLNAVAGFFRRTEPHSPVAYLVERAARWGQIPLDQWLREVIHDEATLAHLRETLGLVEPTASADAPAEASS